MSYFKFFSSSWTTEEEKREKVFNLPRIQEMIRETHKVYENQSVTDHYNTYWGSRTRVSVNVTDHYNEGFWRGSMCPPNPGDCYYSQCQSRNRKLQALYNKYNKRCKVKEILADQFAVPADRTQTPEEALELSIWSPHSTFNMSVLRFCRTTIHI